MPDFLIYERRGDGADPSVHTALDEVTAAKEYARQQGVPAGTKLDVVPVLVRKRFAVDHRRQTVVTAVTE